MSYSSSREAAFRLRRVKSFPSAFQARLWAMCRLSELTQKPEYKDIDRLRNILAHRLAGRRSVQHVGRTHTDGTYTYTHEVFWHVPDLVKSWSLTEGLLQHHLNSLTALVSVLASAARQFAETKGAP
jgi:hypothetical protein